MTDQEWTDLEAEAATLGKEAGENAAAWWQQNAIGGRATGDTLETARRVLQGLEDGDPETLDALPFPNLSGEWADDPTPATLYAELGITAEDDTDDMALCDAWQDAASSAVQSEVERLCREHLEGWEQ